MKRVILIILTVLIFTACMANSNTETETKTQSEVTTESTITSESDWSEATHSNSVDPDYDTVFNSEEVKEIYITIDEADWETMMTQLSDELGSQTGMMGGSHGMDGMGDRPEPPENGEMGDRPQRGPGMGGRGNKGDKGIGNTSIINFDPVWVESDISVDGITWENVGIRVKGNSSLSNTYKSGGNKYSFKLDFDEFEDEYPELKNQRFYGFKQLNLNNNLNDSSFIRESVAADLFREYGVTASETALAVVYVDYGSGTECLGVYTLVEEMDDTVIETQYGDDSGNLYKPDGEAATFGEGTYNEEQFYKKSNEDEADYSDVNALYEAINSSERVEDIESWKAELEEVFDIETFLRWLAVNTVIQNWDTYGQMSHNYFMYNNPETGKLEWISWDNNESLQDGKKGSAFSLSLDEVSEQWPLIRYILDDSEYYAEYKGFVEDFTENYFSAERMSEIYDSYYEQLKDYAELEISASQFSSAIELLKSHAESRNSAVESFIKE